MTKGRMIVVGVVVAALLAMVAFINYGHLVLGHIPNMINFLKDSQYYRPEEVAWQEHCDARATKEDDLAVDFELWDVNGEESVRLSDFRGDKPVALLFGSYT